MFSPRQTRTIAAALLMAGFLAVAVQLSFAAAKGRDVPPVSVSEAEGKADGEKQFDVQSALSPCLLMVGNESLLSVVHILDLREFQDGSPSRFLSRGPPALLL